MQLRRYTELYKGKRPVKLLACTFSVLSSFFLLIITHYPAHKHFKKNLSQLNQLKSEKCSMMKRYIHFILISDVYRSVFFVSSMSSELIEQLFVCFYLDILSLMTTWHSLSLTVCVNVSSPPSLNYALFYIHIHNVLHIAYVAVYTVYTLPPPLVDTQYRCTLLTIRAPCHQLTGSLGQLTPGNVLGNIHLRINSFARHDLHS